MEREWTSDPKEGRVLQPLISYEQENDEVEDDESEEEVSRIWKRVGLIWAILAAVSSAADTILVQKLTYGFSPMMILFFRQAVLLGFALFLPWNESKGYDRNDFVLNVLFGLADTFGKGAFITALSLISAGDASAISFNKPVPTSIVACIFLGELFDAFDGALVFVNCIGLVLIAESASGISNDSSNVSGVVFAFAALLGFVSVYLVTRILAKNGKADPCLLPFMTGWIGVVFCTAYLTVSSSWLFPDKLDDGLMFLGVGCATIIHYYSLARSLLTENMMFVAAGLSVAIPLTYFYDVIFNAHKNSWQNTLGAILTVTSTLLLLAKTYCKDK